MADFVFLYRNTEADAREHMGTPEAMQSSMKAWMAWMSDLEAKGHLKSRGEPLERTGKVLTGPKKQVTDGPFPETKELIAGFWMLEVKSKAEAIEWAKKVPFRHLPGSGRVPELELRQVFSEDDFADVK